MSNKVRNILATILIVFGIGCLAYSPVKNYFLNLASDKSQEVLHNLDRTKIENNENKDASFNYDDIHAISLSSVLEANRDKTPLPAVGEIAVPEVGINLPIVNGVSDYNMLRGATTLKAGQKMGVGNYSLASHYSPASNETLLFSPLIHSKPGMKIYITDLNNIYTYTIESITLVNPEDVHVLDETGENIITLVTCNDISASKRRIVVGKLTNITNVKDASDELTKVFQTPTKTY